MKNEKCINCGCSSLERFIDLGDQPNGNHFPSRDTVEDEIRFPLSMAVCRECWQVQLEEFPSPEFMFSNHPYITGVNMPVVSHFDKMVKDALHKFPFSRNSLVIDIGANDGTLLTKFRDAGMRVFGIDPSQRTWKLARDQGITVCKTFWDDNTAKAFNQLNFKPDIITATAVIYHLADIHSFVKGLAMAMHERSIFLTQCIYLKDVIEKLQFDHFYHEHIMIHAIGPLERLFSAYGLRMLDVDFYPVHGGSFVLYVGKENSPYKTSQSVREAIDTEIAVGLQKIETFHHFSKEVEKNGEYLVNLLRKLKEDGKTIYALGAPVKGSTLMSYCGIGPDLVELATEVNRFKIGKLTPGTHIPIVYEEAINKQPDYYLVLSWNFIDFFIEKHADFLRNGGKFIVPHPSVHVIDESVL